MRLQWRGAGFSVFLGQEAGLMATAPFTFQGPTLSIGWIVAFVILVIAVIMGFMGLLPKEAVMLICAVAAIRL